MISSAYEFMCGHCAPGDRLLLAVSGGADSLAMLLLLADDAEFRDRIVCATVDHGLRECSAEDAEFLRGVCEARGIRFDRVRVDAHGEMQTRKLSLEAAARRVRYQALEEMRKRNSCEWILTAHTLEDDAETVLMKLRADSSWYECTGIPKRRGVILRPFLDTRRSELRSHLSFGDVSPREDEHNVDLRFLRVRVRHWLRSLGEDAASRMVQTAAAHGRRVRGFLDASREAVRSHLKLTNKQEDTKIVEIDIDEGIRYLHGLAFLPVEAVARRQRLDTDFRLSAVSRRRTVEFVLGMATRGRLLLPEGVELHREGRRLRVISARQVAPVSAQSHVFATLEVSKTRVCGATRFRTWRHGETFKPAKRRTRKVADWLRDRGVPIEQRSCLKVLCDDLGIIGIPGLGVAERVFPQADEETLRVNCVD